MTSSLFRTWVPASLLVAFIAYGQNQNSPVSDSRAFTLELGTRPTLQLLCHFVNVCGSLSSSISHKCTLCLPIKCSMCFGSTILATANISSELMILSAFAICFVSLYLVVLLIRLTFIYETVNFYFPLILPMPASMLVPRPLDIIISLIPPTSALLFHMVYNR
jgi:hypothetical protein